MRLDEKVAVITGAAEGIGRSCALQFARGGGRRRGGSQHD